jgi:hypothetical protein
MFLKLWNITFWKLITFKIKRSSKKFLVVKILNHMILFWKFENGNFHFDIRIIVFEHRYLVKILKHEFKMVAYMNLDIGKYVNSNIIWANLRVKSICWT